MIIGCFLDYMSLLDVVLFDVVLFYVVSFVSLKEVMRISSGVLQRMVVMIIH
jgi:hypothetical protein